MKRETTRHNKETTKPAKEKLKLTTTASMCTSGRLTSQGCVIRDRDVLPTNTGQEGGKHSKPDRISEALMGKKCSNDTKQGTKIYVKGMFKI